MDTEENIGALKLDVKQFCEERDWDQFHDAKELAIGIATEAGELLQHFRFLNAEQIQSLFLHQSKSEQISLELADVLFFVLRFSQLYGIDLSSALRHKIELNAEKYPIEKAKGSNLKYTDL